ncbi:MAG: aldehyde dehydrogenase family protein [Treponema sp.]|nr:aldehyde dehydrogenase family protein [Candidatus Treponema caballi]
MTDTVWTSDSIHSIVDSQRAFFNTGATLDVSWRIAQLKKLRDAMYTYETELEEALARDLGRTVTEAYFCDIGTVILEANETIHGLRKWARPEKLGSGLVCFPSTKTKVYKMPYGVSLIISPFNFPILLALGVLVASIAGGNCTVIKASSKTAACTAVMQKIIAATFPPEFVTVIGGGHDVADMCLAERFDKIFYTGSPNVAKHVMTEAAKNLTPVALELGGETGNWAIVRADADLRDAARKIAFFKICNSGQVCININQVAVAEEVAASFIECLKEEIARQMPDQLNNEEYPHLANHGAWVKCRDEAALYEDRIVSGGHGDENSLRFETTVMYPIRADEPIVNHELFCPLLPVVPFKDSEIDSLLQLIQSREKGLALYVFTKNRRWAEKTMSSMQFGGGCINEVCLHLMVKGAPFNGTGHSGMGAYHGEWGFREFTHPQTVLIGKTHFNLPLREHPYNGKENSWKLKLIKLFEK